MDILLTLTNIIRVAPELVMLGFCIQYLTTSKTTDAVLLTVGLAIGSFLNIFYSFVYPSVYDSFRPESITFMAITFVGLAGQILFAVGLILLIKKAIANWTKSPSIPYKHDPDSPLDSGMR